MSKRKIIPFLIVAAMIPLSMALFCRCLEASLDSQTVIAAPACHDCCPHRTAGSPACESATLERFDVATFENIRLLTKINLENILQPVSIASDSLIVSGTGGTDLSEFPFPKSQGPLFLLHHTLLI